MTRARVTLADRFRDPRNLVPMLDDKVLRAAMLRADRMVLDDAAARLAVQMGTVSPREVVRMIEQVEFPERPLWLEFNSRVMLDERILTRQIEHPGAELMNPDLEARTAILIKAGEDDPRELHSWCIEDTDPTADMGAPVMIWPVGVIIYPPGSRREIDKDPQGQRQIWGFADDVDIRPLMGRAAYLITGRKVKLIGEDGILHVTREMAGWARLTLGALAMLQTVTTAAAPERAPGHVREGGGLKPHLATSRLSLQVPHRIRNVAAHARRRLAEEATHRKRLHEVRWHYRHLRHEPRVSGWAPVLIDGSTFWRKRIAGHLRGDPSLGVVEHDVTVVHGPRA